MDKAWHKASNKNELETGLRVRFLKFKSLPDSKYDSNIFRLYLKDKKEASEFVVRFSEVVWQYGALIKWERNKDFSIRTDSGGTVRLPPLHIFEVYSSPKVIKKWKKEFDHKTSKMKFSLIE